MNNIKMMTEDAIKEKYLRGNKAKLNAAKLAAIAMVAAALILSVIFFGADETKSWVYDKDEVLSESTVDKINQKSAALYGATGEKAEIVVVVEVGGERDLTKKAEKLFKEHKVGNDGMLFVVSVPQNASSEKGAVGEWAENMAENIGGFFGGLFGNNLPYAYFMGRNVDYSLVNAAEGIFNDNFKELYEACDYNAAVVNTFDAFYSGFENLYGTDGYDFDSAENVKEPDDATPARAIFAWIIIPLIIIFAAEALFRAVFSKKNAGAARVYKNFSWFSDAKK